MLLLDDILSTSSCLVDHTQVIELTNGLSHQCFKVITKKHSVFLKIFLNKTGITKEQWKNQQEVQIQAAKLGFGPAVIESCYQQGYLVTEFIDGKPLSDSGLPLIQNLSQAARVISQCQQLKCSLAEFEPRNIIDYLLKNAALSLKDKSQIKYLSNKIIASLAIDNNRLVVSHGDVNFDNIVIAQQQPWLIDWEYCVLAEPEFDLGMCLAINNIDESLHKSFISDFNKNIDVLSFSTPIINTHKVTRYYELSLIINALWFFDQNIEPSESLACQSKNQSIKALERLLQA
ncbi:phosphotransferase [Thalassotalea nanhaiensis]|uniref:Phosphotransferase n=1 Tax=Thalassotalea nanhaiensis TaxID=3065648 RepID=A0ABY9TDK4_9GAMM|nr:phosphotransferase [Colwelliaceae bacterium SQ345]